VTGASAAGLSASSAGADPGFTNAEGKNFTLAAGSGAMGKAATAPDQPDSEYYRDEQVARRSRTRASAKDLGAFESTTTSVPTGPYGAPHNDAAASVEILRLRLRSRRPSAARSVVADRSAPRVATATEPHERLTRAVAPIGVKRRPARCPHRVPVSGSESVCGQSVAACMSCA
jgi:hypothetical protein